MNPIGAFVVQSDHIWYPPTLVGSPERAPSARPGDPSQGREAMIVTELGLCFRHEGTHWRCIEKPELLLLPGGEYALEGSPEAQRVLQKSKPSADAEAKKPQTG